jgi:precorrin-3B synthase
VRLSPWRGVVLPVAAPADVATLQASGFVVDAADPAAHVVACVGAAGCASGAVDAAGDARAVIDELRARPRDGRPPTVHVSGCAKACASRGRHDVTLVGRDDGTYDVFDGWAAGGPLGALVATGAAARSAIGRAGDGSAI